MNVWRVFSIIGVAIVLFFVISYEVSSTVKTSANLALTEQKLDGISGELKALRSKYGVKRVRRARCGF
jgi:hypothetical protein